MLKTIFSQKYTVLKILSSNTSMNCYIANKNGMDKNLFFLVNEICDRNLINEYIAEVISLNKEVMNEFEECFTENSKLYVIFSYVQGTNIQTLIEKENFPFEYKISFIQKIIYKLMDYPSISYMLKTMALMPENVILQDNLLSFNYQFFFNEQKDYTQKKELYIALGNLIQLVFSDREFEKHVNLGIVAKKSEKGIYHSLGEVMKDLEDVSSSLNKEVDLKVILKEKRKKIRVIATRMFAVIIVCVAGYVVYQKVYDSTVKDAMYTDVEKIGTVDVEKSEEQEPEQKYVLIENDETKQLEQPQESETSNELEQLQESEIPNELEQSQESEALNELEQSQESETPSEPEQPQDPDLLIDENGVAYKNYVIKVGDNLTKISKQQYGSKNYVKYLQEYNHIKNPSVINPGKTIKIPVIE